MTESIIQQYLNKCKFELIEIPSPYYKKSWSVSTNLDITLVIVFQQYNITFAKYLTYQNKYYCFELMKEQTHNCRTVVEVLDLIRIYNQPISGEQILLQLEHYQKLTNSKIFRLKQENNDLQISITNIQRAMPMFKAGSLDWQTCNLKLDNTQNTLSQNQKEINLLNEVLKELGIILSN